MIVCFYRHAIESGCALKEFLQNDLGYMNLKPVSGPFRALPMETRRTHGDLDKASKHVCRQIMYHQPHR